MTRPLVSRLLGVVLLLGAYAPVHRLLDPARAGPAAAATRASADGAWEAGVLGTVIVVGLALALARLLPGARIAAVGARLVRALDRPAPAVFAAAVGALATVLAAGAALGLHRGLPTSVDEMAQLLHARALVAGRLSIPTLGAPAATVVQNGIVTPDGWVSIYPPLHTLALALGLRVGAPWLVGPVAVGAATALATRSFERLLGRATGRTAGALLAVTPFWILLGGTHLSHTTAAAALALVLYCALRAREGGAGWAVATGAAVGAAVAARPWISLACATALLATLWLPGSATRPAPRAWWLRRAAALGAGGAPFAALLFWWNARLFGSPLRLGYTAAFGPAHGLGLHADPWGNAYGPVEAAAYTGADLVQLGAGLLESPLPALAVVGLGLLLDRGRRTPAPLVAWVVAALAANAAYWHHGVHFGPRMLYETTPAWVALFVVGAGVLASRPEARGAGAWCVALALAGGAVLTPGLLFAVRDAGAGALPRPAFVGAAEPTVVFAHGSWASRIAAELAAAGMRRDSIETALRRNDVCAVDRYARWRAGDGRAGGPPPLDLDPLPGSPPTLGTRQLSPGNSVRVAPDGPRDEGCAREAAADRLGAVELETLLWRAPPLAGVPTVVVRDLGPTANAALAGRLPGAWRVYVAGDGVGGPRLLDYEDGMELLWRGAAGAALR